MFRADRRCLKLDRNYNRRWRVELFLIARDRTGSAAKWRRDRDPTLVAANFDGAGRLRRGSRGGTSVRPRGVANPQEIARRISPIEYVRTGLPAILSIHGDADTVAPYAQAPRLHKALDEAKVPNRFLTTPGRGHGDFRPDESVRIYEASREFLRQHVGAK